MSEPLLQMRSIIKTFDGAKALDGINLVVRPDGCVGLCGKNDAGEPMLMKVLSSVYPSGTWDGRTLWGGQPLRAGSIRDAERTDIVIIHQELIPMPKLSVAENIYLGDRITLPDDRVNYAAIYQNADKLLRDLNIQGINVTLPMIHYGSDHRQLIEIVKALNKRAKLLILDKPSSSLTAAETRILLNIVCDLKARGIACVCILHKLDEVEAVCDTVTVIRDDRYITTALMDTLTTNRVIAQVVGRGITQLFPREPHPTGEVVFETRNVTCYDANNLTRKRVDGVSFSMRRGKILGVAGLVGTGRTELMQAVSGAYEGASKVELVPDRKSLKIHAPLGTIRVGTTMVPEDRKRHGIVSLTGVGYNITLAVLQRFARLGRIDGAVELDTIRKEMRRFAVRATHPMLPVVDLSGGNQQKAVLIRMLPTKLRVLILDGPTRNVDVGTKYEIYKLIGSLAERDMVIIVISSELPEMLGISSHVLVIREDQLRGDFVNDRLTQEHILTAVVQPIRDPPRHAATFHQAGRA